MKTKQILIKEAAIRYTARAKRSTKEQLALLGTRPGEAKLERARLGRLGK